MQISIDTIAKFFNSLMIRGVAEGGRLLRAQLCDSPYRITPPHTFTPGVFPLFEVQFLLPSSEFPSDAVLTLVFENDIFEQRLGDISPQINAVRAQHEPPLINRMGELLGPLSNVLSIGGRARSTGTQDSYLWRVKVLDIVPAPGVDIVADVHEMSQTVTEHFDGAICVSVFEHLLMPWKAAVEIARVLKIGAYLLVHTHQTIGMHDIPWDFYRYSDQAWAGIFNLSTGFEIVQTQMVDYMHIIPALYTDAARDAEKAGGFLSSGVLARKVSEPTVDWNVPLKKIVDTAYPLHESIKA